MFETTNQMIINSYQLYNPKNPIFSLLNPCWWLTNPNFANLSGVFGLIPCQLCSGRMPHFLISCYLANYMWFFPLSWEFLGISVWRLRSRRSEDDCARMHLPRGHQWLPNCCSNLPSGNDYWKWQFIIIYSGFTHWQWWFAIVILVYQRVSGCMTSIVWLSLGWWSLVWSALGSARQFGLIVCSPCWIEMLMDQTLLGGSSGALLSILVQ